MGTQGELFTTEVVLNKKKYFFNVKENRSKDVFLQIVESKVAGDEEQRLQIAVFEDDMQKFLQGLNVALSYIDKSRKDRVKLQQLQKEERAKKRAIFSSNSDSDGDKVVLKKSKNNIKKTGKVHIVSKKSATLSTNLESEPRNGGES